MNPTAEVPVPSVVSLALIGLAIAQEPAPTGRIDAVVVYPDRASVTRVISVDLVAGDNVIEFRDLPPTVDERSITAEGLGVPGATLRGIDVVSRELAEDRRKRVSELEGQIQVLDDAIRADQDAAQAARIELAFLQQLQPAAASQVSNELFFTDKTATQADALAGVLDLRVPAVQKSQREAEFAARDKDAQRSALQRELETTRGASQWARRDVKVQIESPAAGKADVSITYMLPGASWAPAYDVRARPDDKKLEITLNALVTQTSGEDWTGARLSLSTARPAEGVDPPTLDPFWLTPYAAPSYGYGMLSDGEMSGEEDDMPMAKSAAPMDEGVMQKPEAVPMAVATAQVTERAVATTFEVSGRTAVPGDGTRRKVRVNETDLPVSFLDVSAPRFDPSAYLVGKGTWTASWPLLAGEVSVFLGESFVGTSHLDLIGTGSDVEIGFGVDDAVRIKSDRATTMTSNPDWMGKVTAERAWTFSASSSRKTTISLELRDRIPQASIEKYRVKYDGDACDTLTPDGLCTFARSIEPGATATVRFAYTLRYPNRTPPAEVE